MAQCDSTKYCRVFGVGIRSLPLKQKVGGSIPPPAARECSVNRRRGKFTKVEGSAKLKLQVTVAKAIKTVSGCKGRQAWRQ